MPKFFRTFLKLQKKYFLTFLIISIVSSSVAVFRTFWFGNIIGNMQTALKESNRQIFANSLLILVGIEIVLFIIRSIWGFIAVKYRGYMNLEVRIFGVDHSIEMNYQNIAKIGSGKLLQIIHSGMESYSFLFYEFGGILIQALIFFITLIFVLSSQNILFLVFFLFVFILVIFSQKYGFKKLKEKRENDVKLNEDYTKQTAKILMNFILLKVFGIKKQELEILKHIGQKRIDNYVWIKFRFQNIARVLNIMIIFVMFGFLYYFGKGYMAGEIELSQVLFIFFLIAFTRQQFFRFGLKVAELSEKLTYIQRYDEIVSSGKSQKKQIGLILDNLNTDIVFKDLYFRYDGQEDFLFENFNLKIKQGEKIAIMGRSGSGKSTLFKLITRMVEKEKGILNFIPNFVIPAKSGIQSKKISKKAFFKINSISYETIFKKIGLFRQDPLVFDGTIADNLTLNTKVDNRKLEQTLQRVGLENLKLDDVIGENGVLLSGGEKQRLALARIFLFDFDILLLDEPTANLDEDLEKQVLIDIFNTYKDKTIIIISHRPFVLELVNRIITMKKGEIISDIYNNK